MKKGLTEIVFILDNSGSMQSIKDDAIGGYNAFIEDQRKAEGETTVTLILFNTNVAKVYEGEKIQNVTTLTAQDYIPQGMTAMNDAIGTAIDSVGGRLNATNEAERPENVIFAIMTDGQENASREYSGQQVKDKVTHQTDTYNWQFIFLGANIDSKKTASGLGIRADFAGDFVAKGDGLSRSMASVSSMTMGYRSTGTMQSYDEVVGEKNDSTGKVGEFTGIKVTEDKIKLTDHINEINKSIADNGKVIGESLKSVAKRAGVDTDNAKAKEDLDKEITEMNESIGDKEDTTPLVSDETAHDVINDDVADIDILAEIGESQEEEVVEDKPKPKTKKKPTKKDK